METVELEIPSGSVYVGLARLAISVLGRRYGVDEERIDDLKIAVSEACTNAVLSNEKAGVDAPVRVLYSVVDGRFEIQVLDHGVAYDADDLDLSDTEDLRLSMSRALLESLVDELNVARWDGGEISGGGGMATTMAVRRG